MAITCSTSHLGSNVYVFNENQENNKILQNLRNQRSQGKFCDITLHVDGKKLPAHRSILAASSPYFESILKNHRVGKEEISIKWPNAESIEMVLDYMYSGQVTISESNIEELIKLADQFLISKLKGYCEQFLEKILSLDNCFDYRDLAEKYSLTSLSDDIKQFILSNIHKVLESPDLLNFQPKKFTTFFVDLFRSCDSQTKLPIVNIISTIAAWVKKDIPKRSRSFGTLLRTINWKSCDVGELLNSGHIEKETLYQENRLCLFLLFQICLENKKSIGKYTKEYEQLKSSLENSAELSSDTHPNGLNADATEETTTEDDAPIAVEPIGDAPTTRSSKRRTQTASASPPAKKPNTRAASQPQEPNESPLRSSRRTRSRPPSKFASNEWVTDEKSVVPPKKVVKSEANSPQKLAEQAPTNENKKESSSNEEELLSQDEDDSNLDDSAIDPKKESEACNRIANVVKAAGSASLAQWKEGIKCPHCCYIGHSATRLEQHLARVHEEDQTYKCKVCNFECKWNREYYKHMKDHFEGPPYKCEDCDYSCDRIQFILSHRMRHTDERPFQCELCSFSSRTRGNLVVHMRIHTGEKPYRCQHCGRCFAMKNTLDQHMATHRDDRPFLCDTCGFTTKYQSHLLSHKRIHSGNVFYCDQPNCNYYSPRRSQLAAHLRSHMSIRSHICSTCGRGFIEKSHLIRHERIHLDEKPFKCQSCDYGSTRRDKLKEHVAKHHTADGNQPKSNYKPRKSKPNARNNNGQLANVEELSASHIIVTTETSNEDMAQISEQEVATANLIYEYSEDGSTPTRVVIQPVGEYTDAQTFFQFTESVNE